MRIILLGAPGAGKGTQARFLANFYHIPLIATGDILRAAVQASTEIGLKAKAIMEQGALLPDAIMIDLVKDRIKQVDCTSGYLLDGFPRTLPQAQALEEAAIEIDYVIEISVDDEDIIKRLSGRRVHPASGRVYHIHHNPPKIANKDDLTGESLILRGDDKPETVRQRLKVYHKQTKPLIDYYNDLYKNESVKTRYLHIDGKGSIEEVQKRIVTAIENPSK